MSLISVKASSVDAFVGSIGVGAHIDSGNAEWTNAPVLLNELNYLGVHNVRDGTPFSYALPTFITLAKASIHFDLLEANVYSFDQRGQVNASLDVARAQTLDTAVPGSILSFEGTNEYTTNSYTLNGLSSSGNLSWGLTDAQDLQQAVRSDAAFAQTPIIAPSAIQLDSLPNFGASVTDANAHVYGNVGEQLQDRIIASVNFAAASAPGKPVFLTEVGISSAGFTASTWGVADEKTQAIIDTNAVLDGFKTGAAKTFLYELMDEPNAVNLQEQTFGLFHANGTPKLVATAIGNLTHILHDDHLGGVALGSLAYSLSGMPSMASSMLLENSHGVFDLVIWNGRAQVYNGTQAVTPPTSNVSVSLAGSATVAIYDPMKSANTLLTNSKVSSVTVGLSADPIILQIMPSGGSKNASTLVGAHVISNAETVQTTVTGLTPAFDPAHSGSSGSGAPSLAELAHLDLVGLHQGFAADYFMF